MSDLPPGERPPRPHFTACRVLKAVSSKLLSDLEKLTWLEIYGYHNGPDGCFAGIGPLAARLGRGDDREQPGETPQDRGKRLAAEREGVEGARRRLEQLGLLHQVRVARRRTSSWYPILPAECVPAEKDPADSVVIALARRLEDLIRLAPPRRETRKAEATGMRRHTGGAPVAVAALVSASIPVAVPGERATGMLGLETGMPGCTPTGMSEHTPEVAQVCQDNHTGMSEHTPEVREVGNNLQPRLEAEAGGSREPTARLEPAPPSWRTVLEGLGLGPTEGAAPAAPQAGGP